MVVSVEEGSSSGSFQIGDLVKFDSSGQVVIATAGVIDGIARFNATGTQATKGEVDLIDSSSIFTAAYVSTTGQTLVGDLLDFTFTAGAHTLSETSAETDVYCVALDPRDTEGASGGRLYVRFLSALLTASA